MADIKPTGPADYFPALTGYRAIAAFLVFVHHFNPIPPGSFGHRLADEGHIGVNLFFVLSGFLIAYRYPWLYSRRSVNPLGTRIFWQYCANRVARIWPIYLLFTALTFIIRGTTDLELWITNLTFLRGFSDRLKFTGIAAGWSLTVEETFYFLAPVLFAAMSGMCALLARRGQFSAPAATRIAIVAFAVSLFGVGLGLVAWCSWCDWQYFENHTFLISHTFFGRCFEFFCGFYAARLLLWNRAASASTSHGSGGKTYLYTVALVLLTYALSRLQVDNLYRFGIQHPIGPVLTNVIMPPVIAALIYCLATEETWISRCLSTKLMHELGLASYCFYLLHQQEAFVFLNRRLGGDLLQVFVALNLLSWLCYKLLEQPMNRSVRRLFAGMTRDPAENAVPELLPLAERRSVRQEYSVDDAA